MIIVRAPLRISFVGGGSDLPDFYKTYPGRVISTTFNKYVYVAINSTPIIENVTARYSKFEIVSHARELKNDRMRAALLDLGIYKNIDIATFSDLPVKTGLGGSSSFSVALLKGLYTYLGEKTDSRNIAEAACRLEIELLKEPIGKQDQYASAFGGFNVFQFNADDTVDAEPVFLDYKKRLDFENHLLLFFTGITRLDSSVLKGQKKNIPKRLDTLKRMSDSVEEFKKQLLNGNFERLGELIHENWKNKRTLASNVSSSFIDNLYEVGIKNGAWGGKILGAGGGGCILFIVPPKSKELVRAAIRRRARKEGLKNLREISVSFVQSGVEILMNHPIRS